jgi:hypothetical protein
MATSFEQDRFIVFNHMDLTVVPWLNKIGICDHSRIRNIDFSPPI